MVIRMIRRFRSAGATDASRAVTLESLNERHSRVFEQLHAAGALVAIGGERYFLNESVADEYMRQRRTRTLILAGVLLLAFLVYSAFSLAR